MVKDYEKNRKYTKASTFDFKSIENEIFNMRTNTRSAFNCQGDNNQTIQENVVTEYIENINTLEWAIELRNEICNDLKLKPVAKNINFQPGKIFVCETKPDDFVLVTSFVCHQIGFAPLFVMEKSKIRLQWNNLSAKKKLYKDLRISLQLYKYDETRQAVEFIKEVGGLMEFLEFVEDFKFFSKQIMNYINTKNSKTTKPASKIFTKIKKEVPNKKPILQKKSHKQGILTNPKFIKPSTTKKIFKEKRN